MTDDLLNPLEWVASYVLHLVLLNTVISATFH